MQSKVTTFFFFTLFFLYTPPGICLDSSTALDSTSNVSNLWPDDIIKKVEARYAVAGFSADFFQTSTIKAMKITDTAFGKAFFKPAGHLVDLERTALCRALWRS